MDPIAGEPRIAADPSRLREPPPPAWVGIGAARCGTTWFTEMLSSHPGVSLPAGAAAPGRSVLKEAHFFERYLLQPWSREDAARYRSTFARGAAPGEFTPAYLRSLWVAPLLRAACGPATLLVVLLRDPVERFRSAVRWATLRRASPPPAGGREFSQWSRRVGGQALWGGMYATQLAEWTRHFDRDRIAVLQYEAVLADPRAAVTRVWNALGLRDVEIELPDRPAWTATGPAPWREPDGLEAQLRSIYESQVAALERDWEIDRRLWPHFA